MYTHTHTHTHTDYDTMSTAGYRDVNLNIRILDDEADILDAEADVDYPQHLQHTATSAAVDKTPNELVCVCVWCVSVCVCVSVCLCVCVCVFPYYDYQGTAR